jgi:hypothetical protein
MADIQHEVVTINGVRYVREDSIPTPAPRVLGNRAVIVLDRGYIYAGDVTRENGRIYLKNVVWVFKWISIGFHGVLANPKDKNATLYPMNDLDFPKESEIFCVPVPDDWGL